MLVKASMAKIPLLTQDRKRTMLGANTAIGQTWSLTSREAVFELAAQFNGEFLERQN